jgi:hypothetical protein
MTICALIQTDTLELINMIVAEPTEPVPEGTMLLEVPEGYSYNNGRVFKVEETNDY